MGVWASGDPGVGGGGMARWVPRAVGLMYTYIVVLVPATHVPKQRGLCRRHAQFDPSSR